jgi:hypothetical protein
MIDGPIVEISDDGRSLYSGARKRHRPRRALIPVNLRR